MRKKSWVESIYWVIVLALLLAQAGSNAASAGLSVEICINDISEWDTATSHQRGLVALRRRHGDALAQHFLQRPEEQKIEVHDINPHAEDPSAPTLYNPAGWIDTTFRGKPARVFIGRRESLGSETDSHVGYYVPNGRGELMPIDGPDLKLQDPFFSRLGNELILGGVAVDVDSAGHIKGYRTVFYRDHGEGLDHLTKFLEGPPGMKDIRLVEMKDGRVAIFTRPQGEKGGRGKIGFTTVESLGQLTAQGIEDAPLINNQFIDGEWGGVNAAYLLNNGKIGIVGHVARFDANGNRDYCAVTFSFDPNTGIASPMEIVLTREDLPGGLARGSKRQDLENVLFPGQVIRSPDGTAVLWGGEGDKRVFGVKITDPFKKYE
jgi:Protein of unknown function (DUF1861)